MLYQKHGPPQNTNDDRYVICFTQTKQEQLKICAEIYKWFIDVLSSEMIRRVSDIHFLRELKLVCNKKNVRCYAFTPTSVTRFYQAHIVIIVIDNECTRYTHTV